MSEIVCGMHWSTDRAVEDSNRSAALRFNITDVAINPGVEASVIDWTIVVRRFSSGLTVRVQRFAAFVTKGTGTHGDAECDPAGRTAYATVLGLFGCHLRSFWLGRSIGWSKIIPKDAWDIARPTLESRSV